jgi:hypothetical protein
MCTSPEPDDSPPAPGGGREHDPLYRNGDAADLAADELERRDAGVARLRQGLLCHWGHDHCPVCLGCRHDNRPVCPRCLHTLLLSLLSLLEDGTMINRAGA